MARPVVRPPSSKDRGALSAVARAFENFKPARQVFTPIRGIKTRLVRYDRATRVGGHPLQRLTLVHGPSNQGKTTFTLAMAASFIDQGGVALFVDAERTLDTAYPTTIMGAAFGSDAFFGIRPENYEHAIDEVRNWLKTVSDARESGALAKDAPAIVVVDSLRKLVPANLTKSLMAEIGDEKKGAKALGADGASGRAGQMRAAVTAAWLDELIPLLDMHLASAIIIGREAENTDPYSQGWTLTGGKAVIFDSSLIIRFTRAGYVGVKGDKGFSVIYGERFQGQIWKTKVGGKEGKSTVFSFHVSNGTVTPAGLDPARDLVTVGIETKTISKSGSWLEFGGQRRQGEHALVAAVAEDPDLFAALDRAVRSKLSESDAEDAEEVEEHTDD